MRIKGALHVHSTLSHDGTMTIGELARFYSRRGYHFVALTEHAEDLDEHGMEMLTRYSRRQSSAEFCLIPGLEFSAQSPFHILGVGFARIFPQADRLALIEQIRSSNAVAVLAHPKRTGWNCPPDILRAVDAVETWNVGYDGKFLPSALAMRKFASMKRINPRLMAVVGHDLHRSESFYDVSLEMDVPSLSAGRIIERLRNGRYVIRSRFFRCAPDAPLSLTKATCLRAISAQLQNMRRARSLAEGWFS